MVDDSQLSNDISDLEKQLDVANIIMAREHAKLEVGCLFFNEVP